MRKIFCAEARSRTRRSISATRFTKAADGTTSPYTKGFSITALNVSVTLYHVTPVLHRSWGPFPRTRRHPPRHEGSPGCLAALGGLGDASRPVNSSCPGGQRSPVGG